MKTLHRRCAGLDVHKSEAVACLRCVAWGKTSYEARRFATTTRRSSCFISRSKTPACAGGEGLNGPPPWASLPFSSASAFQEQHDDENNRHHGIVDYRLVRTFAVKPRAFGNHGNFGLVNRAVEDGFEGRPPSTLLSAGPLPHLGRQASHSGLLAWSMIEPEAGPTAAFRRGAILLGGRFCNGVGIAPAQTKNAPRERDFLPLSPRAVPHAKKKQKTKRPPSLLGPLNGTASAF